MSAEVAVVHGKTTTFMITGRRRGAESPATEHGGFMPAPLDPDMKSAVERYVERVVEALGFDVGMAHVELILTAAGPHLIEFNPRLMGGDLTRVYEAVAGRSIFDDLLAIHLDAPGPIPTPVCSGAAACRKLVSAAPSTPRSDPWPRLGSRYGHALRVLANPLRPGAAIAPENVVGRFMVTANDAVAAERLADEIAFQFASETGIALHAPESLAAALPPITALLTP
jgi:hypothetical protein